jgi:glycosyltransferase involved in cell wall biosynthesis
MKIRFCTFSIAKYGGIIQHIETKFEALKEQGHDVDIIILDYKKSLSLSGYKKKVKSLEDNSFQDKLEIKSQNGGYSKSAITGYWSNPYYGWLLEPNENILPCLDKNSLDRWHELVDDADLIIWSFVPTKTSAAKGFNWWHEYFDLPKSVVQVLTIHDGYYDLRNSWTNTLRNKISFLECVHITGYQACAVFDIPRLLNLDSRKLPKRLSTKPLKNRQVDFFSAHIWKSMKRMEDLLSAIPHIKGEKTCFVAGSGIELYYMMTEDVDKQKPKYTVSKKTDPDCKESEIGLSIFQRAEKYGMEYLGIVDNAEVNYLLQNAKFAIDPSFCSHYAKYVNTHLNGFIIEAIANGCYPILRDYRKDEVENDFIFKSLRAIYIPYDATPKEFARYLNSALKMGDKQYLQDTLHNFKLAKAILDPYSNMEQLTRLAEKPKLIKKELERGKSTPKIQKDSMDAMTNFFKYNEMPDWMI